MKNSALKLSLVSGLLLLSSTISVLAVEPSYFVLGDSTASATTQTTITPSPTNIGPGGRLELRKEDYDKRKLEYQTKLKTIRDTRKQTLVSNLSDKMAQVNKRRTEFWKNVLSKLSAVLTRAKSKTTELKNNGKDTTAVALAISNAESAISVAQAAVDAQAAKTYIVNITTDTALKTNVGQAISAEEADLQNVRKAVDAAYKAVADVIKALKQLIGITTSNFATPSGGAK